MENKKKNIFENFANMFKKKKSAKSNFEFDDYNMQGGGQNNGGFE